jgi:GAF domain-containing protein
MVTDWDWEQDKAGFILDAGTVETLVGTVDGNETPAGPLAQQFVTLTRTLLSATTVAGVLNEIVVAALRLVPGADLVSVTLRDRDGTLQTPLTTDPVGADLDKIQYTSGRGPGMDATDPDGPAFAVSNDLAQDQTWPAFAEAATGYGFCSVLSTALLHESQSPRLSGALNLYSRHPHSFNDADRDTMLLLATHASLALATTTALTNAELQAADLLKALDSRDVIGQAKGILMHRRGITADQAFDLLRNTSQDLNVKLADIAATLASRHAELDSRESGEPPAGDG